jgi:hypothetical protein
MMPTREYAHAVPDDEVRSVSGAYVVEAERRIDVGGREVLVVLGHASFDTSCCGAGGCRYALVPGYVVAWKQGTRGDGDETAVSEVEPVAEECARKAIRERILAAELVQQVNFW